MATDALAAVSTTELTPLRFLARAAEVHPAKVAIAHGARRITYGEMAAHATRLAHALRASGVRPGDRVAYLCPNIPELLIAHYGVPLAGAVLVAINTRLAPAEIRHICAHSRARLLVVDAELHPSIVDVADALAVDEVVTVVDPEAPAEVRVAGPSYDELLARGADDPLPWEVVDERATISVNYTSGTTGNPKGVMYSHRGTYLSALGQGIHCGYSDATVYLWTLPMFHCNGWCTTWAITAAGGRHVCLRAVRGDAIWTLIAAEGVTHLNGAPAVLSAIADAPEARRLQQRLTICTGGAPPSPTILARMEELNAHVIHLYGLTETYGPYAFCQEQEGWADLATPDRARLLARQGVGMVQADRLRVVDDAMADVPADGTTMGEIVMRGNNVMTGYLDDPEATAQAFRGGWFHSGDLGVLHPDGYVQLMDRAKDVVISGGENISTVEVEQALLSHAAVADVAVVGVPDDRWGERPKAFVVLRDGAAAGEDELIAHVREQIAHFKAPREIAFLPELPRTSTGKVQKYELREREWAGRGGARIQ